MVHDLPQLVIGVHSRVAVAGAVHLRALAEGRVGFIEEENDAYWLGGINDATRVLFRFSDVLGYQGTEIQMILILGKAGNGNLIGESLAGT